MTYKIEYKYDDTTGRFFNGYQVVLLRGYKVLPNIVVVFDDNYSNDSFRRMLSRSILFQGAT